MRRQRFLALLASLCLLALSGAAEARSSTVSTSRGDAVLAAQSSATVAVRTLTDRLAPQAGQPRHHVLTAALPPAVLGPLLLAALVVRRRNGGTTAQTGQLAAAGRGPPVTS